jgi:hypothetical protein
MLNEKEVRALVAHLSTNIEDTPERLRAFVAAYELLGPYVEAIRATLDEQPQGVERVERVELD